MELSKLRFLVVEDSEELLAIWRILFKASGIVGRFCATSGEALRELASGYAADILVTDYYLPDDTGLSLYDRAKRYAPSLKCILITGNTDPAFIEEVASRGDVCLVLKPVPFPELKTKILEALRDLETKEPRLEASTRRVLTEA